MDDFRDVGTGKATGKQQGVSREHSTLGPYRGHLIEGNPIEVHPLFCALVHMGLNCVMIVARLMKLPRCAPSAQELRRIVRPDSFASRRMTRNLDHRRRTHRQCISVRVKTNADA